MLLTLRKNKYQLLLKDKLERASFTIIGNITVILVISRLQFGMPVKERQIVILVISSFVYIRVQHFFF